MTVASTTHGLIQIKIRSEVKRWIEQQAKEQDRSQAWITNQILEDACRRFQQHKEQNHE